MELLLIILLLRLFRPHPFLGGFMRPMWMHRPPRPPFYGHHHGPMGPGPMGGGPRHF